MIRSCIFFLIVFFLLANRLLAQQVLMFVSHEDTYYSEYIVMKEAFEASGYSVDVRSASNQNASVYMIPNGTTISATANTLSNSSYSDFTLQFESLFGMPWNEELNAISSEIIVYGSILDIEDMAAYDGLIVVGGTGALDYRFDGDYASQGSGDRLIPAATVGLVAEKLNDLAIEAVLQGKPVMAQCHGASIPLFWRVPETSGPGVEAMGFSLLKGGDATGFPEEVDPTSDTQNLIESFGATFRPNDRVVVSSPHESLMDDGLGDYKIVTTKDWYPQTVAHAAKTFLNILKTYPTAQKQNAEISILILHGGATDPNNCSASNKANDIPCNYAGVENLPADWTHLHNMLTADSDLDGFSFAIGDADLADPSILPFDPMDEASVLTSLESFDVVIFYKHWSTGLTDPILQALTTYVDNGGGVIALHHGLYNDQEGAQNKDILVSLFGAQSAPPPGWSASLQTYDLFSTNYGHFISTYGIAYDDAQNTTGDWWPLVPELLQVANRPFSFLPTIEIFDEIYNNTAFEPGVVFGSGINEITPLFTNNGVPNGQAHTAAFTKVYDGNQDGTAGKLFYIQAGERQENYQVGTPYSQLVRNAVVWAAPEPTQSTQTIDLPFFADQEYGSPQIQLPELASSGLPIFYESADLNVASVDGNVLTITGVGSTTVTASQAGDTDFSAAPPIVRDFEVLPAPLSIVIDDKERSFGQPNPVLTGEISGIVNGDIITVEYTTVADPLSDVGTYEISFSVSEGASRLANYSQTIDLGELTIVQAQQQITFDPIDPVDLEVANAISLVASVNTGFPLDFEVTQGAQIASLNEATLELTLSGPGTVTILVQQVGTMNYQAASAEQTFNVISSALNNQTIDFSAIPNGTTYGDVIQLQATATSTLTVDFELVEGTGTINGSELTVESVGDFLVRAKQSGDDSFNPANPEDQSFSVAKKELVVSVEDIVIVEGSAVPALNLLYSGFEFNQGPSDLDELPTAETQATELSVPGTYDIVVSGGSSMNYELSYENGTIDITAKPLGFTREESVLYPNPVHETLFFKNQEIASVQIFSNSGKLVQKAGAVKSLDISHLPNGLYFVQTRDAFGKLQINKVRKE